MECVFYYIFYLQWCDGISGLCWYHEIVCMTNFQAIIIFHITHRNNKMILLMKPTRCTNFFKFIFEMKLYMFRTVPLSTIGSFSLYTQSCFMPDKFVDSCRAGSGWNILIPLDIGYFYRRIFMGEILLRWWIFNSDIKQKKNTASCLCPSVS
jgi:hypothetical protein